MTLHKRIWLRSATVYHHYCSHSCFVVWNAGVQSMFF